MLAGSFSAKVEMQDPQTTFSARTTQTLWSALSLLAREPALHPDAASNPAALAASQGVRASR